MVDAAVIGGAHRWKTRLAGLREELHRRYQQEEEPGRNALRRKIAAVENLAEAALPIIEMLGALPESATWGEWTQALQTLADLTLREPERVLDLLEELEPMADIGPVGLGEVDVLQRRPFGSVRLTVHATEPASTVQRATF